MYNFIPYYGDTEGLPTNDKHINIRWAYPGVKILFSFTQRGKAIVFHFAADKKGRRKIKQAITELCNFLFDNFEWCKAIVGPVKKASIVRIGYKCGFELAGIKDGISIMMRKR